MVQPKLFKAIVLACFLFLACGFGHASNSPIDLSSSCFKALKPVPNYLSISDEYPQLNQSNSQSTTLPKAIVKWLEDNHWTAGFELWRQSQTCHSGVQQTGTGKALKICELNQAPIPTFQKSLCQNKSAAINFLAMHKHLIQSRKTLWPRAHEVFSSWEKFPKSDEDDNERDAQWFYPWPDEVLENAMLVDMLGKMSHKELLSRWPTEKDFAHWLFCGASTEGEHANAIVGAMQSNVVVLEEEHAFGPLAQGLTQHVFWKNIAWLDRAWDRYRMRVGKTPYDPDLQATVLKQCQNLEYWINASKTQPAPKQSNKLDEPSFTEGQLNPKRAGTIVRLLGELIEIRRNELGQVYALMRLNKFGTKPLWITSRSNFSENSLLIGKPYVVVGSIARPQAATRKLLDDPLAVLLVNSLQTPK